MPFDFACKNIFIVGNFSTTWSLVEKETGASTRWGATIKKKEKAMMIKREKSERYYMGKEDVKGMLGRD